MLMPHAIWSAREPTDMRRRIDTLTRLADEHSPLPPGTAVVFCNKARSPIKVLQWHKHGVWLCTHRLHQGNFTWPRPGDTAWLTKGGLATS